MSKSTNILTLMLFGIFATLYGEEVCPPERALYPCYCSIDDTDFTSVTCEKTSNMDHIKNALNLSKGWNVSLDFADVRFGDIPSDLFQGQISSSLSFHECQIGSFGDRPFSGLENTLTRINIYDSINKRVKDLKTFPLSHLKNLKYLYFEGNDIKRLGNDWFTDGPKSLKQASLQANDIEELGDKAFSSLTNLQEVWLGDNNFKVVHRSMFPRPANNLSLIEISFNGIESFPEDLFVDMPSLRSINVSGNKFTTLLESIWGKVWNQLEEVYVGRSQLVCDEKIKWIYKRKLPKIFNGSCAGYNSLRRKRLEDLTLQDFEQL